MTEPKSDVSWNVVSQIETVEPGLNNQITRGVTVTYKTSLGTTGSVFVPNAVYSNTEAVRQIVANAVANHVAVQGLQG